MALRTWNSGGSTDMNLATNYTGAGALLVTDDLVWDGTSVINSTATAPLSVATITVAVGYTGTFNDGGFAIQTSGAVSITPGGTFTASGTWTQTGDANFVLANSGAYTVTGMDIDLQGTGNFQILKTATYVHDITCAAVGKVTMIVGTPANVGWNGTLTLGTGTLTLNGGFVWSPTVSTTPIVNAGATINGISALTLRGVHAAAQTITLPALNMSGTGGLVLEKNGGDGLATFSMAGAITSGYLYVRTATGVATATILLNSNGQAITATDISYGVQAGIAPVFLDFGASVVSVATVNAVAYNGVAGTTVNMGTSVWTVTGAYTAQTNHTIVPGTSIINFTGLNATFTTAGKNFGGIVSNKNAGQTLTQAGALNCAAFTVAGGNFTSGNNAITASGNVLMGGGTLNLGTSAITCTGNAITARISATVRTTAASVWTFSGTSAILDLANAGATTISRLILQAGAAYTWTATANVLTITLYVAGDWDNTTWTSSVPGTPASILAPAGVVVIGMTVTDSNNSGAVIDATAATNTDGGGNTGWAFPAGGSPVRPPRQMSFRMLSTGTRV